MEKRRLTSYIPRGKYALTTTLEQIAISSDRLSFLLRSVAALLFNIEERLCYALILGGLLLTQILRKQLNDGPMSSS